MKKIIISLILIVTFVVGCVPTTCNQPYILVGNSCCLDQNDNGICDSDETVFEKLEEVEVSDIALITKRAAELGLYSNEVEAGYSLNRKSSGIYQLDKEDFPELKLTDLKETFVTSYTKSGTETEGTRWLTMYTRVFDTVEGAEKGFQILKDSFEGNPLFEKKDWLIKIGEENVVFLHEYRYDSFSYSKYIGLIRLKNTISQVILNVPAGVKAGQELENYMKKLELRTLTTEVSVPEADMVVISKIGNKKDNLLEVKINGFNKGQSVPREEAFTNSKIENVVGTEFNYLTINLYLKNIGIEDGFDTSYYNFILNDEKGNYYTADYRSDVAEGSREGELIPKGTSFGTAYFFKILKDSKNFTLTIHDEDAEIYQTELVTT
ncbi:MAG: hypothetical protein Q7S55_04610 [Nanoarchaeota archaeon]|nr:hypothetical protein [Nanoarchaeota archaeon]